MDLLKRVWKPLLHRLVTGRWKHFHMLPVEPAFPSGLRQAGLYLHVPFCKNLCPFCPYNRQVFEKTMFARYERAVRQEIDLYTPYLRGMKFISLYIGGGTPTIDVDGLVRILEHLKGNLDLDCDICIELHPSNMSTRCLEELQRVGVNMLSIGVESTSDTILKTIGRNHDRRTALNSTRRAVEAEFASVNVDLMFALPGQTLQDWTNDLHAVMDLGVDQISTYPLFSFPYSELGQAQHIAEVARPDSRTVRTLLQITDTRAKEWGYERCAVWSWIKPKRKKFSSITRHHYIGFGPSAASMTGTDFYVNTFDVEAYVETLPERRPVALSMPIDQRLEMAYWLYWRTYELKILDQEFRGLFGKSASLDHVFRMLFQPFLLLNMMRRIDGGYAITRSGAYWIHRLQNEYSLSYINRLWGGCRGVAWPEQVKL
jgi:oxygen-independent coproporphyrinogen-3 oxidase